MDKLLFTLNVVLPIILPIFLGYSLKRIGFLKEEFLNGINKLVFVVLLPVLLFSNIYLADLSTINWAFCGIAAIAIFALFGVGLIVVLFIKDPKQKGVMLQASFRSNYAIIGIPLATLIGGDEAGAQAAVVAAISVPLFNMLAVIALSMFDKTEDNKIDIKRMLFKIVTNPLIIGVVSGVLVCLIGLWIDAGTGNSRVLYQIVNKNDGTVKFIGTTIDYIGRCATPMALLVLGGKFEFSAVKKLWPQLTISVTLRLIITPTVMLIIFYLIGYRTKTDFAILIALFATPIAVSSVPMAAQMGQDEELAGQIVVWTSALSAFSLFFIILICSLIGIF
ncbi:MAG: AEC family transporter [Acholeplasmatales bacterium]|nr:AEC family transporter [Acholeplasmatales bacterium]